MHKLAPLGLVLIVLSGCTARGPVPSADGSQAGEDGGLDPVAAANQTEQLRTFHFNQTFTVHVSEAFAGDAHMGVPPFTPVETDNCVGITGAPQVIRGSAKATWTPQTPAEESLMVHIAYSDTGSKSVEGKTGVELDMAGILLEGVHDVASTAADNGTRVALLSVNLTGPAGAAAGQEVELTLTLEYEAASELRTLPGYTCQPLR